MDCRSYRTIYEGRLLAGECDCGWVSDLHPTPRTLHAAWFAHSEQPVEWLATSSARRS